MSEKLYSAKCFVPGHGTWCEVAQEKIPAKRGCGEALNRIRRRRDKDIIAEEMEQHLEEDWGEDIVTDELGWCFEDDQENAIVVGRLEIALRSQHPEAISHCPPTKTSEEENAKCFLNNCVLCWTYYFLFGRVPMIEDIQKLEHIKRERK